MVETNVINISALEGIKRIDAEYYQHHYLNICNDLKKIGAIPLKRFCASIKKGIFDLSPEYYVEFGIPFIRTTEIKNEIADLNSVAYIPEIIHLEHKTTELRIGDIVFTKIGANIGDSAILPRRFSKYNFSQNVAGARIKSDNISPYYLAAYLASKYGRIQLKRVQMPSGQGKLELIDIKKLLIYVPKKKFQKNIEKLYLAAEDKLQESIELYSYSNNLLLKELGIENLNINYESSFTAKLSDAYKFCRIDAEYFQPGYDVLIENIKKQPKGYMKLLDCAKNIKPNFNPKKHPDRVFSYIELADVDSAIGTINSKTEIKGEEAPSRAKRILKRDDILVSRVEGSLEKIALVNEKHEGSLASNGFFQFRAGNISPEVLFVISKSIILQGQFKKECSGSILTAVPSESIKRILIPIIADETQREITKGVNKSHQLKNKAKELVEYAKKIVELEIKKKIISTEANGDQRPRRAYGLPVIEKDSKAN